MEDPDASPTVNLTGTCQLCICCCRKWPDCWDNPRQCHGDTDGDGDVDIVDWSPFRDSFGKGYPAAEYNPCADFDRDGDVDIVDWSPFRNYFGKFPPADCTPGDPCGVYCP
jgi:hypothetical protein